MFKKGQNTLTYYKDSPLSTCHLATVPVEDSGRGVINQKILLLLLPKYGGQGMHVPPTLRSPGSIGSEKTCKVQTDLKPQYKNVT